MNPLKTEIKQLVINHLVSNGEIIGKIPPEMDLIFNVIDNIITDVYIKFCYKLNK